MIKFVLAAAGVAVTLSMALSSLSAGAAPGGAVSVIDGRDVAGGAKTCVEVSGRCNVVNANTPNCASLGQPCSSCTNNPITLDCKGSGGPCLGSAGGSYECGALVSGFCIANPSGPGLVCSFVNPPGTCVPIGDICGH